MIDRPTENRTDWRPTRLPIRAVLRLEKRVVNPLVVRVLRSRFHGLLSKHVLVLSYEGRASGTRYTTPVAYEMNGQDVVVVTIRDEVVWWKNFRDEYPATLTIAGESVDVEGTAITDPGLIADWITCLAGRSRLWEALRTVVETGADRFRSGNTTLPERLVVVRFTPVDDTRSDEPTTHR